MIVTSKRSRSYHMTFLSDSLVTIGHPPCTIEICSNLVVNPWYATAKNVTPHGHNRTFYDVNRRLTSRCSKHYCTLHSQHCWPSSTLHGTGPGDDSFTTEIWRDIHRLRNFHPTAPAKPSNNNTSISTTHGKRLQICKYDLDEVLEQLWTAICAIIAQQSGWTRGSSYRCSLINCEN